MHVNDKINKTKANERGNWNEQKSCLLSHANISRYIIDGKTYIIVLQYMCVYWK